MTKNLAKIIEKKLIITVGKRESERDSVSRSERERLCTGKTIY